MGLINSIGSYFEKYSAGWIFGTQNHKLTLENSVKIIANSTNRVVTLPAKSGTVAFLDDIPASYGLYSQIELSTPVVNTTVETTIIGSGIGILTVPANAFKVGDSFVARMCGKISSLNNANLTIKLKSNGVILGTIHLLALAATTNKVWELEAHFTVSKIGGLGVAELRLNSTFVYNRQSNGEYIGSNILEIDSTNFNTTIQNTLDITATWETASPSNSIQSQNFNLTKIF
jgi:hypothetical protein